MDIGIDHLSGDQFSITVRGHQLLTDQPVADGGEDQGPTPTELFVASLGACIGFYARRAMRTEVIADRFPKVTCSYTMSIEPPPRIAEVSILVEVPATLSDSRRAAVERAIALCTVSNSIRTAPVIALTVSSAMVPADCVDRPPVVS